MCASGGVGRGWPGPQTPPSPPPRGGEGGSLSNGVLRPPRRRALMGAFAFVQVAPRCRMPGRGMALCTSRSPQVLPHAFGFAFLLPIGHVTQPCHRGWGGCVWGGGGQGMGGVLHRRSVRCPAQVTWAPAECFWMSRRWAANRQPVMRNRCGLAVVTDRGCALCLAYVTRGGGGGGL